MLSPQFCLRHSVVPWVKFGDFTVLATSRPEEFDALRQLLPASLGKPVMAVASATDIRAHVSAQHRAALTEAAESRVAPAYSYRSRRQMSGLARFGWLAALVALVVAAFMAPFLIGALVTVWALITLTTMSGLKAVAFLSRPAPFRPSTPPADPPLPSPETLPHISVMVPLFREADISSHLIARLRHLTYPKALLEVLLVLEEKDDLTAQTIARADLPDWMRMVIVPAGSGLTTKPRALNYALDHCRGEIVGIWDAEDAPDPDQLDRVAAHFAAVGNDVACLQGILDYYNPSHNWISRCFTIEYASWFRVVLPGLARLGIPIPLGGTTLFLRRDAIEDVGGWDAHNVTEDADLGIRLARHGYRTELIDTVTREEAACRPWAWMRQRSRWLKGYMVTYLVHMRRPILLYRQLGLRGFLGFQVLFLATSSQFLLAPVIWSCLAAPLGFPHPVEVLMGATAAMIVAVLFVLVAAINVIVGLVAVSRQNRGWLMPWVPLLALYFPLATVAAYKALSELLLKPFYWDKTAHFQSLPDPGNVALATLSALPAPQA